MHLPNDSHESVPHTHYHNKLSRHKRTGIEHSLIPTLLRGNERIYVAAIISSKNNQIRKKTPE